MVFHHDTRVMYRDFLRAGFTEQQAEILVYSYVHMRFNLSASSTKESEPVQKIIGKMVKGGFTQMQAEALVDIWMLRIKSVKRTEQQQGSDSDINSERNPEDRNRSS